MGNFNYQCEACGWGEGGEGEDGRDYFDKPAAAILMGKDGQEIVLKGSYTGYGEVELPSGHTFWPDQFEEYFESWIGHNDNGEKGPFRCRGILCEECMEYKHQTSFSKFSFNDFKKAKDYLAEKKAPPAAAAPPVAAPAVAAPVAAVPKPKKGPKPKALTKDQLVAKVAALEAELAELRPLKERIQPLQEAYDKLQKQYSAARETISGVHKALNEGQYYY